MIICKMDKKVYLDEMIQRVDTLYNSPKNPKDLKVYRAVFDDILDDDEVWETPKKQADYLLTDYIHETLSEQDIKELLRVVLGVDTQELSEENISELTNAYEEQNSDTLKIIVKDDLVCGYTY